MASIIDFEFNYPDVDSFVKDMTPIQAESLLGGYCQLDEDYYCAYITNVTKNPSQPKSQPGNQGKSTDITGQKINTIDNSRKIYINGVPIKEQRNMITICW